MSPPASCGQKSLSQGTCTADSKLLTGGIMDLTERVAAVEQASRGPREYNANTVWSAKAERTSSRNKCQKSKGQAEAVPNWQGELWQAYMWCKQNFTAAQPYKTHYGLWIVKYGVRKFTSMSVTPLLRSLKVVPELWCKGGYVYEYTDVLEVHHPLRMWQMPGCSFA